MATIGPSDGPVAVTGASGYIGSWIVRDLVKHGYTVRACVRDIHNPDKVSHLLAMNDEGLAGAIELHAADLSEVGSYDVPFAGCAGVVHAGAVVGYNKESPQEVYDGCFTEVEHVVASAQKAGSVKRFVFTSSFAAVGHPRPPGYVFTERDWCGDNVDAYKGAWVEGNISKNRDIAYAMAKANTERMIYDIAKQDGSFEALAILPLHVIGPLMCANHDQNWSWQNCIKFMLLGRDYRKSKGGRMLWNNVDVRDVGAAHRLCLESPNAKNGSRYILSATDPSGELFTWQLQAKLQSQFPDVEVVGGEEMAGDEPAEPTYDSPRAYCTRAIEELGLQTHAIDDTIRDTVESYQTIGLL